MGTYLVPDETMVFWTGTGEMHITFLARKPKNFGIMMKTACCGESRVMVAAEIAEGAARDERKEYRDQVGATTATTLRLCKPWAGSGRTVIAGLAPATRRSGCWTSWDCTPS